MLGLKNILINHHLTQNQQIALLKLLNEADCFFATRLAKQLQAVNFSDQEVNRIIQQTLNTLLTDSCNEPDFSGLLTSLASDDSAFQQRTELWLAGELQFLLNQQQITLPADIAKELTDAFTPKQPEPSSSAYDNIIVLDSDEQSIYPGLAFLETMLQQHHVQASHIIAPTDEHLTFKGHQQHDDAMTAIRQSSMASYTNWSSILKGHVTQDEKLSSGQLGDFIFALLETQQTRPSLPGLYAVLAQALRRNRTLVITPESSANQARISIDNAIKLLKQNNHQVEILPVLNKYPVPSLNEILTILKNEFNISAADTLTPAMTKTNAPTSQPVAAVNNPSSYRGTVIFSIAAFTMFAASNPEATQTVANIAAEAAVEGAKGLAAFAVKRFF